MIPTAVHIAETRVGTLFLGGKFELVLHIRKRLHLHHECWNPNAMNDIRRCQVNANAFTNWQVHSGKLFWGAGNRFIFCLWVSELPGPLDRVDINLMNRDSGGGNFGNRRLIASCEVKENCNDD